VRRPFRYAAHGAVTQLLDKRIDDEQAGADQSVDEDVDSVRSRHLPFPPVQEDAAVGQRREQVVAPIGESGAREHRQVRAEAEVGSEELGVGGAVKRRRGGHGTAHVHRGRTADPREPEARRDRSQRAEARRAVARRRPDPGERPGRTVEDLVVHPHPSE